jgi:hypothetical protein
MHYSDFRLHWKNIGQSAAKISRKNLHKFLASAQFACKQPGGLHDRQPRFLPVRNRRESSFSKAFSTPRHKFTLSCLP